VNDTAQNAPVVTVWQQYNMYC